MRPSVVLQIYCNAIRDIALSHRVVNVRVFASVLYGTSFIQCAIASHMIAFRWIWTLSGKQYIPIYRSFMSRSKNCIVKSVR